MKESPPSERLAQHVERDKRTILVENASYRWAYFFLTYALLVDVVVRGFMHHEASWDLLALVVAGGAIGTAYQAMHSVLSSSWVRMALTALVLAAAVAVVIVLIR